MKSFKNFLNKFKFSLISLFLILYFVVNFFDGNRGYLSYQNKTEQLKNLYDEETELKKTNERLKMENKMLSDNIDLEYLDEIYRKLFVVGKKDEILIIIK